MMEPDEYRTARETLGWTHGQVAETLGVSKRTVYRIQTGDETQVRLHGAATRLLRLLVRLRLTMSERGFEEVIEDLRRE